MLFHRECSLLAQGQNSQIVGNVKMCQNCTPFTFFSTIVFIEPLRHNDDAVIASAIVKVASCPRPYDGTRILRVAADGQ